MKAVAAVVASGSDDEYATARAKVDGADESWVRCVGVSGLSGADVDDAGAVANRGLDCPGEVGLRTGEDGAWVGRVIEEDRDHDATATGSDAVEKSNPVLSENEAGHMRAVDAGGIAAGRPA